MTDLLVSTGRAKSIRGFKLGVAIQGRRNLTLSWELTKPLFERSRDGSQYQRRSEDMRSWISRILEAGDWRRLPGNYG